MKSSHLFKLLLGAACAESATAAKCNPEAYAAELQSFKDSFETNPAANTASLVLLPQDKGDESPACLDGSPYGFFFAPSKTGSTKWTISINGGGWCYDEIDCYCRSKTVLGTSKVLGKKSGCACMNPKEDGSFDNDCNCINLPYSDGASFSGYRAKPWPVPEDPATGVPAGATVTFRGIKNFDAVLDFAFKHGMTNATEFVLTGGSAGGLSTFLHADRVADRLKREASQIKKIRAAPVVGYFLDHDNFKHTTGGKPNTPEWAKPGTGANYTTWMKYVYFMQNMTFGADGALSSACYDKHKEEPWLCFMSPHMQDVIQTPYFMFNSKYDQWQLGNEFQSPWQTKAAQQGVLQYGKDFMTQLEPALTEGKHGGMITSCVCHGCPWDFLKVNDKNSYEHFADWFYGKTKGKDSFHIDTRLPNGDGALAGGVFKQCVAFPKQPSSVDVIV